MSMTKNELQFKKMTETPISKLIVRLGIPTTISMLITGIYNLADTYFVGALGESPQAATGILFTLQCIIQAVSFMLGHGSGTFVSKALADKDTDEATRYVSSAFFIGAFSGLLLTVFGYFYKVVFGPRHLPDFSCGDGFRTLRTFGVVYGECYH